jgi:hypothetical protein
MQLRRRAWTPRLTALLTLAILAPAGTAGAAVPFAEITSAGPLTGVALGNELSCQVSYTGDARFELFPSAVKPGDCGTLLVVGETLFAPNFAEHDSSSSSSIGPYTAFTPVGQSAVGGAGTSASPFKVTTVVDAGASGIRITQVDSYVTGQESYRTDTTVGNSGGAPVSGVLYRAGDCYLQDNDTGFGFVTPSVGAVGCSSNANNAPAGRIEQWYPITGSNQYMQARYSEVWGHIATHAPFPNTTRATESLDNGAGISWAYSIAPGASKTFSHYTTFSPRGVEGPPAPPVTTPSSAFGPNGLLDAPAHDKCLSKRYFRIKLRKRFYPIIVGVTIKMPKTTRILRRPPWGTIVDLRGLVKGRFPVRITALTTTGKTIKGTRHYRTCAGKLRGGKPKL